MNQKTERFARTHLPCPCGSSSDAYSVRQDGSGKCFSCDKNFQPERTGVSEDPEGEITYDLIPFRSLSSKTVETYNVRTKLIDGVPYERGFPYGGKAAKVKTISQKNRQKCVGDFREAGLFGQDVFDPGSREGIILTEGEEDAMAAHEMTSFRMAAVSLKSGAGSAYNDLSRQDIYDYVNSFEKIYICFDADERGQQAVMAIQGLFDFRKVYHVKIGKYKDANEYLENGGADDFERTLRGAKRFAPDNIISGFGDIERALEESSEDQLGTYPFPDVDSALYGLHAGEIIVVKAPEGVGKTEFFRSLEHHLLRTTDVPIGIIHLEEDNATTIKAIAGYELEVPAVLPDCGLSKQDILSGYKRAVRDSEGRVHIHSSFDVEDEAAFLGNLRFLVSAAGCRFLFLDHITWLATGQQDDDERKKLDRISQKLKLLAKELRFCLVMISHVNDDGKTRGSRNITKVANTVIDLSRDLVGGSQAMIITIEKARLGGRTGPAGKAYFDRKKGKLLAEPPEVVIHDS